MSVVSAFAHWLERPGRKMALAVTSIIVLALLVGIYLGRQAAYRSMKELPRSKATLVAELSIVREALKVARNELQIQRTRHEVDSRALELLRSEMAEENERTADLEEGLRFYRSMVVSDETAAGLSLRKPELVPGKTPGSLAYRIFIQQKEREYEMVEGILSVEVFGVKGGVEVTYPLSSLSNDFDQRAATLHFRYFQAIEGELVLPDGFEPKGMTVAARASKPREAQVREQFSWELQERFINVGN